MMTATHASLLLPFNQDNSAITTATQALNLLLYAQIGSAITTATHAQNLLLFFVRNDQTNSKLQLIVECLFLLRDSSLLLFCVKDALAIMMAPFANF
jgi:hypothetical protein